MKKLKVVTLYIIIGTLFLLTGCVTDSTNGKKSRNEAAQAGKIDEVNDKLIKNDAEKILRISSFSYGIQYSLNKITNPEPTIVIAKDLNTRILTLSGNPLLDDIKRMELMINNLISTNQSLIAKGQADLNKRDKDISLLQEEHNYLLFVKDKEIEKYMTLAKKTAGEADSAKAKLNDITGGWGFSAIWFGIKTLFTRLFYTFLIGTGIYILLFFLSKSSPIAASIFSVVELIVSWFINILTSIAPKSINFANLVPKKTFDEYKGTLTKIIDVLQLIKTKETDTKKYSVEDIMEELKKTMSREDTDRVDLIKKEIGWK